MSDVDYTDEDFPDFDSELDNQPDGKSNPDAQYALGTLHEEYANMLDEEFRNHVISMLEQAFQNQHAIHEATTAAFDLMETRLQDMEISMRELRKKMYADNH